MSEGEKEVRCESEGEGEKEVRVRGGGEGERMREK